MNLDLLFESYMSCLLLEARDKDYVAQLEKKGFGNAQEITDTLVAWNDPKKEKTALHFILNGSLDLSKDLEKFNKAYVLIDRQHLDFNKFKSLDEVLNRTDSSTERILSKTSYDPDKEPCFSNKKDLGNGTIVYQVEDSKEGQKAARKAVDLAGYGPSFNGWCLLARKSKFSEQQLAEFERLSPEQLEDLGFYDEDDLAVAWSHWEYYSKYPKRIAFKNGKLVSFSAGNYKDFVEWWDREDESHSDGEIPYCNVSDDLDFLMKYGKRTLANSLKTLSEILVKLAEDRNENVRTAVAGNKNTPAEVIAKLTEDKYCLVRSLAIKNPNIPVELLVKLAEGGDENVRQAVAENPMTPTEILKKLAEDKYVNVRKAAAENPNAPAEALVKLSEDVEDSYVRVAVAGNQNTPVEILVKLSEDEDPFVRRFVAYNLNTPAEVLAKLVKAEDGYVSAAAAENPNTPLEF